MILPARAPLEPPDRPLRALYLSLNGPVVTLESFPSGPARAAVAVHEEGATLCVRSARTAQLRFFTTTRALAGDRRVAADAALSFAESMGFLFDDDEVAAHGDRGVEHATARWLEVCGEPAEAPAAGGPIAPAAPGPPPEILLDEPWEVGPPEPPPPDARAPEAWRPEPLPTPAPVLLLSKFRRMPAAASDAGSVGGRSDPRLRLMSRF